MDRACYEGILRLRAIREFASEPLDDGEVAALLEAARWTGSSKNRQRWAFIVVTGERKERLAECGDFSDPLRRAPVGIALVQEPEGYEFDIGRAAQNVMVAADALGLASCPVTLHREEEAALVLELPPRARCRYAVAAGRPAPGAGPARFGGRRPLSEVAFRERYGVPWPED